MLLLVAVACSEATEPEAPYPATVLVSPEAAMVEMSTETVELTATVKDQNGDAMANVTVAWSSEDTSVATVNSRGVVTPIGDGVVKVVATADTVSGAADITVQFDVQREALLRFYESMNGDDWIDNSNWGTDTPLNTWHGVTAQDGNVSRIEMIANDLVGEIPVEIGLLEHLRGLSLGGNEITGSIPPEIGNLENLTGLWLWGNEITGPIPARDREPHRNGQPGNPRQPTRRPSAGLARQPGGIGIPRLQQHRVKWSAAASPAKL